MVKPKKERGEVLWVTSDMVYQLIMFVLLIGGIFAVYFFVRSLLTRSKQTNKIEQKLDRVIEMLEKDKRD
ncbi:DUF4083 domain-containing protein [Peribacillus sp. NPDC101480]|uniref:DUF4083 domain-containing protein n=1 Tax=Peribacillus sp. NPDC101480 TaxID=3390620 RepID=UPI003D07FC99